MRMPVVACVVAIVTSALPAFAQHKANVFVLTPTTIVGQRRVPVAAIDVSKVAPVVKLTELQKPFADRADQAVHAEPF